MRRARLFATITAVPLVLITLPVFLTISGLSLMTFDTPPENAWPFLIVGSIWTVCATVPIGSLIVSMILIQKKNRIPLGLTVSLLPLAVVGIFWLWLSQQSFT